jgi:lipopolysaccharide transport system ATP-binding protein
MSDTIIRVENLGKKYIIGHQAQSGGWKPNRGNYVALRDVLANGVKSFGKRLLGKERRRSYTTEEFWALKDINFEIKRGEVVGIIGRNGAGKSTLLKILSRITEPTTGRIELRGRVASLLEVGTGFHPELTGRENIYLNGSILGMSRLEIRKKFDEIVAFAEVERFLDTPVKRYSSGMYVRLAFAVAAHLEPEILVVDEVLAVGDAAFQKKCLGKMQDVATQEGRTVLFVSHNMSAISQLTQTSLLLSKGKKIDYGITLKVVKKYIESNFLVTQEDENSYSKREEDYKNTAIEFQKIKIKLNLEKQLEIRMNYMVRSSVNSVLAVKITNSTGITVMTVRDTDNNPDEFSKFQGSYMSRITLDVSNLVPDIYFLTFSCSDMAGTRYDFLDGVLSFEIHLNMDDPVPGWTREGIIFQKGLWKNEALNIKCLS